MTLSLDLLKSLSHNGINWPEQQKNEKLLRNEAAAEHVFFLNIKHCIWTHINGLNLCSNNRNNNIDKIVQCNLSFFV